MSEVLIISPHPDDEAIGCGGTILHHVVQGDKPRVIFLTSGEHGGHGTPPAETAKLRESEAASAAAVLGVESIDFWRMPDGKVKATPAAVERLRAVIERWNPAVIYAPHEDESHPDHRAAARIVRTAVSSLRSGLNPLVRMYEVWTPLRRVNDVVDVTVYIEGKLAAIRAHKSQCAVVAFDEAARGLARYRGELHCWPDGEYAEVFARMRR